VDAKLKEATEARAAGEGNEGAGQDSTFDLRVAEDIFPLADNAHHYWRYVI
jgi:hypothetical protein